MVPRSFPTNKEIYNTVRNQDDIVVPPVRNMRHVNPVRQSGPIPAYSGTYTMEDIKKVYDQTNLGYDLHYCQMDVDEVMRRVPGVNDFSFRLQGDKLSILWNWGLLPLNKLTMLIWHITLGWMFSICPIKYILLDKLWLTPKAKKYKYFGIHLHLKIWHFWMLALLLFLRL